jgi:GNAT superfamily N-acetyltransferase
VRGDGATTGTIRRVGRDDVETVVALVHELADYERAPDECTLTPEQLDRALFGPQPALFGHVAELDGRIAGTALWFLTFSTWNGVHGIHLEDLYVRPRHRGAGLGGALLAELAAECVRRGYSRLEFSVLDWNEPALRVYRAMGAEPMSEWTVHRITGPALEALGAAGAPGSAHAPSG